MEIQYIPCSSSLYLTKNNNLRNPKRISQLPGCFNQQNSLPRCLIGQSNLRNPKESSNCTKTSALNRGKKWVQGELKKEEPQNKVCTEKGTVAGAAALIVGTSIGSGILALPVKTSPAGLLPSSITLTLCWAFLLVEAILLVEINVELLRRKKKNTTGDGRDDLDVISIRTMARETLGECGGALATLTYVFLGYTSMIAYASKSGEIIYRLGDIPEPVSGFCFTILFTILISVGGTRATDQVNQVLTASMIGLLVAIEVLAILFGGWSGLEGNGDWGKVPPSIPVMIFSLVYHDLAPVLCAYLGGDLKRIRTSVLVGSMVPLVGLLVWDAIALGLSNPGGASSDPVELLMRENWSGVSVMVEAFSLLAVGTSLIGTLLGFSQFFKEQLNDWTREYLPERTSETKQKPNEVLGQWWGSNRIGFAATAMVIAPSLFVSTTIPDAFSAATDIAGGYCMTVLYGVLPPAMAWAMHHANEGTKQQKGISSAKPALLGVGLFACGIVVEQVLLDLSIFHS